MRKWTVLSGETKSSNVYNDQGERCQGGGVVGGANRRLRRVRVELVQIWPELIPLSTA